MLNKTQPIDIVLVHGWGLNSEVWRELMAFEDQFTRPVRFHLVDIPGYGQASGSQSSAELSELVNDCLAQAPRRAVWVGWSLGGMIALKLALQDDKLAANEKRVIGLQLINSTPRFVKSNDWQYGVELSIFQKFCDELANDYERALQSFLLLQAGTNKGARNLARQAAQAIGSVSKPSRATLQLGIDCLAESDLRDQLSLLSIPTQIVCGSLDRVTNPKASGYLAECLKAELVSLKTGHAPFLSDTQAYLPALTDLLSEVHDAA